MCEKIAISPGRPERESQSHLTVASECTHLQGLCTGVTGSLVTSYGVCGCDHDWELEFVPLWVCGRVSGIVGLCLCVCCHPLRPYTVQCVFL